MPQMANITVKKADGTTDIVYTAMSPSAGDKTPAIWRSNSVGTSVAQRPEFRATSAQLSGNKRQLKTNFVYPIVDAITHKVVDYVTVVMDVKSSLAGTDADVKEAVFQALNLNSSTLMKQSAADGFAPT